MTLSLFGSDRYLETLYTDWGQSFSISTIIHREKSDFWDLIIFENPLFGRVLAVDGTIQTTEADEAIYHEMMAHVPLLSHPDPKKVLILGGGDGGLLREVLRHPNIERVVMVEIDPTIIELSKQYLPMLCQSAFEDPRAEIVIQDASLFVKETEETFDIILCDSTDPIGPGRVLFTQEFYGDCKNRLNSNGIFINQNGVPSLQPEELTLTLENRSPHFKYVSYYLAAIPTYAGGMMAFGWASDAYYTFSEPLIQKRLSHIEGKMHYYNPSIHIASFALPEFIHSQLTR